MKRVLFVLTVLAGLVVLPCQAAVIGFVDQSGTNSTDWITEILGIGGLVNANVNFDAHPVGALSPNFYLLSDGVTLTGSAGAETVQAGTGPDDGTTWTRSPAKGRTPHRTTCS